MRTSRHAILLVSLLCVLIMLPVGRAIAAEDEEPPMLLGRCTTEQLDEEPFAEWFREGHADYTPDAAVLADLRGVDRAGLEVTIFFGTWCGDSRREVPRLLKLFDEMGLDAGRVALIGVDGADEMYKRSPDGEEQGLEIYRVPTVVVSRDGREVNRLVEHPVLSLERDLLAIFEERPYEPSYRSYPVIRRWLSEGLLADENVNPRGLGNEIRHVVSSEGELAAAGHVLLTRGDVVEAVKLFQINCSLHRDSARSWARLANAWLQADDRERAREAAERALRLNEDADRVESLVELIDRTQIAAGDTEEALTRTR